jgi:hypothetical protein
VSLAATEDRAATAEDGLVETEVSAGTPAAGAAAEAAGPS